MVRTRRAALLVGMTWLGLTACGEQFTRGGGEGGSGGTSSGTAPGTVTGTDTGTSSGTSSGSSTGTSTGTTTGTSSGTVTGTATGSTTGTVTFDCPEDPCAPNSSGSTECTDDDDCLVGFCTDNLDCCEAEWSPDCAESFVRTCGVDWCPEPIDACAALAPGSVCWQVASDTTCTFSIDNVSANPISCITVCGAIGARCVGGLSTDSCPGAPLTAGCETNHNTLTVMCTCALECVADSGELCAPGNMCAVDGESQICVTGNG